MKNNGSNGNSHRQALNFSSVLKINVPVGRNGKHKDLITKILADLERANAEAAVRVPLEGLNGEKMQNVRSALNRVTREKNMDVATSTDDKYLYVWRRA